MTQKQLRSRSRIFHVPHGIAYAIENSLWALRLAYALGFRWIDIDGQVSKDGIPMAAHWAYVTKNGYVAPPWFTAKYGQHPRIDECLASDLCRLYSKKTWFRGQFRRTRMRTLGEVLAAASRHKGMGVMYEEKDAHAFKTIVTQRVVLEDRIGCGLPAERFMVGTLSNLPGAYERLKAAKTVGHTTVVLARGPIPRSWEPYIDYVRGRWVRGPKGS